LTNASKIIALLLSVDPVFFSRNFFFTTILSYSETSKKRTVWEQYKIEPFCHLMRGCPF